MGSNWSNPSQMSSNHRGGRSRSPASATAPRLSLSSPSGASSVSSCTPTAIDAEFPADLTHTHTTSSSVSDDQTAVLIVDLTHHLFKCSTITTDAIAYNLLSVLSRPVRRQDSASNKRDTSRDHPHSTISSVQVDSDECYVRFQLIESLSRLLLFYYTHKKWFADMVRRHL
jgi:hypothetical protein